MGFKYPIKKHAKKGMMVQMLQNENLKTNHLLPNELFKWKKNMHKLKAIKNHKPL
jgi:hypothetical protein